MPGRLRMYFFAIVEAASIQPLRAMIRVVKNSDCKAIAEIYNGYIVNSTASFEIDPVSEKEMEDRISNIALRYPYFVYETENAIAGYCYAHAWKERAAYGRTLETTVYLSPEYRNKGIASQLMKRLIDECRERNYNVLIACITAENEASRAFHAKLGFRQVSLFEKVGMKFGRELDVVDYELILNP